MRCVRIQNFLSVESAVVDFSGEGITLVCGPTGSGKSALLVEPLLWQFYDILNRPVEKKEMSGVKRRYRLQDVAEETSVETWFSNAGHEYYVKRTPKSGWEVFRDNSAVTPYKTKGDGTKAMLDAVGLPDHLFRAIAVMGQGFSQRFSGFKDSDRTTIIEDFLGAVVFEKAQADAKQNNDEIERVLQGLSSRRQAWEQSAAATERDIETATQQLNSAASVRLQSQQALEAESAQLGQKKGLCTNRLQEIATERSQTDVLISQWASAESTGQQVVESQAAALSSLRTSQTSLQVTRDRLAGLSDRCPTCLQTVDVQVVQAELHRLDSEIANLTPQIEQTNIGLQNARTKVAEVKATLASLRTGRDGLVAEANDLNNQVLAIDKRFEAIQSELTHVAGLETAAKQNLDRLDARLLNEQTQLQAAVTAENEYASRKPYLSWWSEGFSIRGIRSKRLGGVLDSMNVKLAEYCEKLFDGRIMVRLLPVKPQKTTSAKSVVSIDVQSPAGSYGLSSGGQERCIDLAIHFALRRFAQEAAFGWSSNFLIGDEVFDYLDRALASRALQVLRDEAQRVFVCTHSRDLQALCDSVWYVQYEDERTFFQAI